MPVHGNKETTPARRRRGRKDKDLGLGAFMQLYVHVEAGCLELFSTGQRKTDREKLFEDKQRFALVGYMYPLTNGRPIER